MEARDAARLTAVVVFPTPPFWLAMAMNRHVDPPDEGPGQGQVLLKMGPGVGRIAEPRGRAPNVQAIERTTLRGKRADALQTGPILHAEIFLSIKQCVDHVSEAVGGSCVTEHDPRASGADGSTAGVTSSHADHLGDGLGPWPRRF
jgi:hypothetical protein